MIGGKVWRVKELSADRSAVECGLSGGSGLVEFLAVYIDERLAHTL
jgi:hypothetical protein